MIKKLFRGQIESITTAAFLVALSSLVSRFLGILRDRILAGEFGAGKTLDIYYAAFRLPDLIFNLLVLGALSAGFIPVFTKLIKNSAAPRDNPEAWRLANNIISILGLFLVALTAIAIFFSKPLMSVFAPGFSGDELAATVKLTRIMFLSPILLGLSGVFGGILQSFKRFFVFSLAPIFYNVGIIIGALYFVPWLGVKGLAWGVVVGALFHLLIQIPATSRLGFSFRPSFAFRDAGVRQIGRLMIPRTFSLAIAQIDLSVSTAIATTLVSGSLAIFNFANNLQSFPIGIFGISFATAVFPALSANAGDKKRFIENFSLAFRQIMFFIIPATVLLLILRAQIIRVVLGSGQFNWEDTVLTLKTLGFFSLSLFAQAGIPLLARMFYARENSLKPFLIGLISVALDIGLSLWLSKSLGVVGLALAFSIANIVNFFLLWIFLRFDLGGMDEVKIFKSVAKFSLAAILAGLAAQFTKTSIAEWVDMTRFLGILIQGFSAGLAGLAVYFITCYILRSEELYGFWSGFKRRLPWAKIDTGDHTEARGI
jgi:putative peptidoglycan lipid II flippase